VAKPVTMPQLGESVTEGTITRWLKAEGDEVEMDEPLAEVDTDKVNAELPSPVAGRIEKLLVTEGSTVDVGTEIVLVAAEGPERTRQPTLPRKSSPLRAHKPSPARRTGRDSGLSPAQTATGAVRSRTPRPCASPVLHRSFGVSPRSTGSK
jgi:pyruvate/2-oxoglutarate dehydrogenase complex dihydrolipoamide acyltransferase (E2) component